MLCRVLCIPGRACGHGSLAELTEVPGRRTNVVPLPVPRTRVIVQVRTRTPGFVPRAYRTCTSSGYGYECRTEHPELPGTGMNVVQNIQKFRVRA